MKAEDEHKATFLRELLPSDVSVLTALANNRKVWDNLRDYFPSPYTEEDAVHFIEITRQQNPAVTFKIAYKGEFAGVIGLVPRSDVYRKSAEIGYWLGEPYWNKGIATAAVNLIVHYGFNSLQLERIDTGVFEYNKASQRVLEKCGFKYEGTFRNAIFKNGRLCDEIRYGKAKADSARDSGRKLNHVTDSVQA